MSQSGMLVSVFVANKSQEGFAQEGFVQSVEMLKETFKSSKICLKGKMFLKSHRKLEDSFSLVLVFINLNLANVPNLAHFVSANS